MRILCVLLFSTSSLCAFIEKGEIVVHDRSPVSLAGYWRFDTPQVSKFLRIDKEWRMQNVKGVSRGVFSLVITVPQHLRTRDFGVILPPVSTSITLRLNGKVITQKGRVDNTLRYPEHSSEMFRWYPINLEDFSSDAEQRLTLEVTGFHGAGGVFGASHIYWGGIDEIQQKFNWLLFSIVFVAAAIFVIAVFHFALVGDRTHRRANLHYVLLTLAMAFHVLGMNGLGYYLFDHFLLNAVLIHFLIALFPLTIIGFTLRYFRLSFPRLRRVTHLYSTAVVVFLIVVAIFPKAIEFYLDYVLPLALAAMALALAFAFYGALVGVRRKIEGAKTITAGLFVYGACVLNDVVFYYSFLTPVKLAEYGFLISAICMALALAGRLRKSTREKEELREWQKEITLAAQIQRSALPQRQLQTPYLITASLFKPMKIIGGDFFAFFEVSDRKVGFFIADVSGHGIAAALLVNMLRSVFFEQRQAAENPPELLANMNRILYPHLNEQFITAAYCFADLEKKCLRVSQAGHPPLFFIRTREAKLDRIKPKGHFLGFSPEESYGVEELDLADYKRLFLYSDGIIEAGTIRGQPYSLAHLEKYLLSTLGFRQQELLEGLERDIEVQTGTPMNADDDSSCIVIDFL